MTAITTSGAAYPWRPDQTTFAPTDAVPEALILQCSTVAGSIEGDAPSVRVAYVDDDEAVFKAEGEEFDEATPSLSEAVVFSAKATQLIRLSAEQWHQDGTAEQLSQSVARALVKRADAAFLTEPPPVGPAVAPSTGLINVSGVVDGYNVGADLDDLVDLVAVLQANGATPTHIVVDPLGWAEIRKIKTTSTDSNVSLLGVGASDAEPRLLNLPVVINNQMAPHTGLVIDSRAVVSAVGEVNVAVSEHQYFSSDSVALRASWRFGHTVVRPERLGLFTIGDGS